MKVRFYVSKEWVKEYREINTNERRYQVYYWIYDQYCTTQRKLIEDGADLFRLKQKSKLHVNGRAVDEGGRCVGLFHDVLLTLGVNSMELISDENEVLYGVEYEGINQ